MATVAARKLKTLNAKKESLFGMLQRVFDLTKKLDDPAYLTQFTTLYRSVDFTRQELFLIIDQIAEYSFEVDENFKPDFAVLGTIEEMCCHIHAAADQQKTVANAAVSPAAAVPVAMPKLPKIELPQFSGDIREWETFYSIFRSLIHENVSLTNADKVHYLVGRLKGPALGICSGIAPTGDNYEIIWQALVDKYQNKRALANSYLNQLTEFKALQGESSKNLCIFLEKFDAAVRALKNLNIEDLTDFILGYQALSKLDLETVKSFELSRRSFEIPTYEEIIKFVKEQAKILEINKKAVNKGSGVDNSKMRSPKSFIVNNNVRETSSGSKTVSTCIYCHKGWHFLSRCGKFKGLTPAKRYEAVRDNNWCYNCLSPNHGVRSCLSERTCAECGKRHHILLHTGRLSVEKVSGMSGEQAGSSKENLETSKNTVGENAEGAVTNLCSTAVNKIQVGNTVLLSTAVVNVVNSSTENQTARFILDSGSQAHLLTTRCCKKLGIKISKFYSSVHGLGKTSQPVRGMADLMIASRHSPNVKYSIKVLLVDKISGKLPRGQVDKSPYTHLLDIPLADDNYYKSQEIDGILGAELFPILIGSGRVSGAEGAPTAIQTTLGYVVMGKVPTTSHDSVDQTFFTVTDELAIEQLITKFWEIEEVPKRILPDPEEIECDKLYLGSYSRDGMGRFTVALPFKGSPKNLGKSKATARCRLLSLERRLAKCPEWRLEYNKVMQDFIEQGHMRKVSWEKDEGLAYYIPHHAVLKPESTTTPVRIVFDASAPSDTDVSLNDILYGGPKLQTDICTLLINFRLFGIAMTADIRQMYRQVNIISDHFRFQRLLWRDNPEKEINTYELTTVAFGVKASPYLALRTIKQLIQDDGDNYPLAAKVIARDLYMDDLVTSVGEYDEAYQLYRESVELFAAGKFDLTKWSTNSLRLLRQIPVKKRLSKTVSFKTETKILGMQWNPETDLLSFKLATPNLECTKRIILSTVAKCYDPIGLISPFILYLKLLVKELWRLKLDWDAEPPANISRSWARIHEEWNELSNFQISRHVRAQKNTPIMLLGFADASFNAYGSVVYLRTIAADGDLEVSLVCAKSKVSPFKKITIPKLELCAVLLLSKLLKHIMEIYGERVVISKIYGFSDSTTVLQWLNSSYIKDNFVANRIEQIRENLPNVCWRHVSSADNPADCLSRGLTPTQLIGHSLWRAGPLWLKAAEAHWPVERRVPSNECSAGNTKDTDIILVNDNETGNHPLYNLMLRRSSWLFILCTTVKVLRYIRVIPRNKGFMDPITAADLAKAELVLIKLIQYKHFGFDIQQLNSGKECSKKLRKLRPFVKDGLLRVGGRLSYARLNFEQQHPVILPVKDPAITKLIDYYHQINLHTGPHLLESLLRQKYWILAGRSLIRKRVQACNHCFRLRPVSKNPLMADLPAYRVQQSKAFFHTGVDYFGPVNITLARTRGATVLKAYVCLFVCMSVKAVHLELVSSLSTAHFLQAFKRFLSRRGPCKFLYSDQGTNFLGAKRVMSELYKFLNTKEYKDTLLTELACQGIEWKFNPPSAPHMGGLWESNVKSAKSHIYRVIGGQLLSYEEFSTLLAQVEALLNSRPLCRLSADPFSPSALTPAHFLTFSPLTNLPAENVMETPVGRLDRFQLIDRMVQEFWKRWHLEYLHTLQARQKWNKESPNIEIGTVVVLRVDNSPPLYWPLGVITEVFPGHDGVIRIVTVKTSKGVFTRPVVKVCPLPTQ